MKKNNKIREIIKVEDRNGLELHIGDWVKYSTWRPTKGHNLNIKAHLQKIYDNMHISEVANILLDSPPRLLFKNGRYEYAYRTTKISVDEAMLWKLEQ